MRRRVRACSRGQVILEMVLVIVAVLAVGIAFTRKTAPFTQAVNGLISMPNDLIQKSDAQIRY